MLAGIFIAVMVMINGKLTTYYGVYSATAVIHLVGLVFALVLLGVNRLRILPEKKLPFHLYLGGAVGFLTVVFNNISFGRTSLSAILALGLLGSVSPPWCWTNTDFGACRSTRTPSKNYSGSPWLPWASYPW